MRGGHHFADFLVGLVEIGQDVLTVDSGGGVRETIKSGVEDVLLTLHFVEELDDDQLILDQRFRGSGDEAGRYMRRWWPRPPAMR